MSSFSGLTREYPQVAIDFFSGKQTLSARAYFLSHVHTDHMVGLHSSTFRDHMAKHPSYKLYCSEVTREFLLTSRKHCHLEGSLVALPVLQPSEVLIPNDINGEHEKLLVTLLPAGHCPGSVMFFFEGEAGNVLYTGDFRLKKGDAGNIDALHSGTKVKPMKSLYIDTTFFDPKIMFIPSREQSCEAMLNLIEEQIQRGSSYMVHIKCKAKYGYEYLFVEIAKAFGMKVHVSDEIMKQYDRVPDLAMHMTTEGSMTQVHACRRYACSLKDATDVITIIPSTMWFNSNAQPDDVLKRMSSHTYRLCFSFHSSYSEICDFIHHLNPANVYPNVIPYNSTEYDMIERLQEVLIRSPALEHKHGNETYKPLGQLRMGKKRKRDCDRMAQNESLEALFGEVSPRQIIRSDILGSTPHETKDAMCTVDEREESLSNEDGGTSDSLFSDDEQDWEEDFKGLSSEKPSPEGKESDIINRSRKISEDSQSDISPCKSFDKYLPNIEIGKVKSGMDRLVPNNSCDKCQSNNDPSKEGCCLKQIIHTGKHTLPSDGSQCSKMKENFRSRDLSRNPKMEIDEVKSSKDYGNESKIKIGGERITYTNDERYLELDKISDREKVFKEIKGCMQNVVRTNIDNENDNLVEILSEDSENSSSPIKSFLNYLPGRTTMNIASKEMGSNACHQDSKRVIEDDGRLAHRSSNSFPSIEGYKKVKTDCRGEGISDGQEICQFVECLSESLGKYLPKKPSASCQVVDNKQIIRNKILVTKGGRCNDSAVRMLNTQKDSTVTKAENDNHNLKKKEHNDIVETSSLKPPVYIQERNGQEVVQDTGRLDERHGVTSSGYRGHSSFSSLKQTHASPDFDLARLDTDANQGSIAQTDLNLKCAGKILFVDLTEPEEFDITGENEIIVVGSQGSRNNSAKSPSVNSSQETYLSPSKCLKSNSQDLFILSSPESSDATQDCLELL